MCIKNTSIYNIATFQTLPSTHTHAKIFLNDADDRTLILAKEQTSGIGQRGKKWLGFPGNFYGSFIFKNILLNQERIGQVSLVTAVALGGYFLENDFKDFSFKWPNDVYDKAFKKKMCGILCEYDDGHLIISIGINFFTPQLAHENITSLKDLGANFFIEKWSNKTLFKHLDDALKHYINFGFSSFQKKWLAHCGHVEKYLQTSCHKKGIFIDLDENALPVFKY